MTQDSRKLCLHCAWRANCAKRFSLESGGSLHCPDYCEDIVLRNELKGESAPEKEEDGK